MLIGNPEISIIMGAYNCEDTISEAIDSIINQTYQSWEFIICDDCSTDKTYEILLKYEKSYPQKIKILKNEKNSKLAFSLNHCLKHAKGEYVARMDADDVSLSHRLEIQIEFMQNHTEYDLVGTAMLPFDENGERSPMRTSKTEPNKDDLLRHNPFYHATILMKKSVYDQLGGYTVLPRTVRGQDADLWYRFFAAGFRGYNLKEPLYKVRERIADLKRRSFKNRIQATRTILFRASFTPLSEKVCYFCFKTNCCRVNS